ncbi:tape measure protein [Kaustia mangrovi]|uniref:Tape measure protein n=1 Tax=Kaustia mangrovi TaxID=2593653 RepID=A0A7S8HD70_9HYPH|nr:tape measure protein [Kaustia mangrovi]QPC44008.1 tape measure protein [Kaustia mangrovi]
MAQFKLDILLTAIDRVTAPMRAINNRIKRITSGVQRFVTSMRSIGASTGLNHIVRQFQNVGTAMGRVVDRAKILGAKLAIALGGAGYLFKTQFIDTAATFERYEVMLKNLEGSSEGAQKAMDWIGKFARSTPLELDDVTDAFVRLRVFGMSPTNGTLRALVDQNAKMGGSAETLNGIILALGQAWTKQKLQGEEILQLIERGVPVWDLLAEATGKNVQELQDLSSEGQLGRKTIAALIEEMGKQAAGAADDMSKTWDGLVSNLMDWWTQFKKMVMDNGVFDFLKERLERLLERVKQMAADGSLEAWAKRVADGILNVLTSIEENVPYILGEIRSLFEDIRDTVKPLTDRFGGVKVALAAIAAVILGPLAIAIAGLVASLTSLGVVILASPLGWFLLMIGAIAAAAYYVINNWEDVKEFFKGLWIDVQLAWKHFIDAAREWVLDVVGWAGDIMDSAWTGLKDFFVGIWQDIKDAFADAIDWIAKKIDWLLSLPGKIGGVWNSIKDTFAIGDGRGSAALSPDRPESVASQSLPGAGSRGGRARTDIKVVFDNAPRGTRVQADTTGDAELDMSVGYNMQEAVP